MSAFAFETSPDPIRQDLAEAFDRAWDRIGAAGTWLSGEQRVAVAEETRRARSCALCAERKDALSPNAVAGQHEASATLSATQVDAVHRITTDPSRLSQSWLEGLLAAGLTQEEYVEGLGVTVQTISIDAFHSALGLPLEPLPAPGPGGPTRRRPSGAAMEEAWVPMVQTSRLDPEDKDLYGQTAYVIRAMSLVPDEVRALKDLQDAMYLDMESMTYFGKKRAIDRAQIELVAGRVSALNECFY